MIKINKKGFSLIEISLVLAVTAIIGFISFTTMINENEMNKAKMAGQQIKLIGDATNAYISNHYDKLSLLTNASNSSTDVGPRTCLASNNTCTITTTTLINEGLLPVSFTGKNVYGSGYDIILKRSGVSPYYKIYGLVTTDTSLKIGNNIRYDLLGKSMQEAGIDSGMTRDSSSQVSGFNGSWKANTVDYSNISKLGQLAYQTGYGTYNYSVFLRRDGTLPMTGSLNMDGNDIINANNITATGIITADTLKSINNTEVGNNLTVSGNITAIKSITSSDVVTGKYLYPSSVSIEGASCSINGQISKTSLGGLLSCKSGIWSSIGKVGSGCSWVEAPNAWDHGAGYKVATCPSGYILQSLRWYQVPSYVDDEHVDAYCCPLS